jgi:putative peptidoglycan lipid II flippase
MSLRKPLGYGMESGAATQPAVDSISDGGEQAGIRSDPHHCRDNHRLPRQGARTLLRPIAMVSSWVMASRVLGFVRDMLIARTLGVGPDADALFVAFRLPYLVRRIFAEGAFNAAFVPVYARARAEHGDSAATRFAEQTLAILLTGFLAIVLIAELIMPWLMALIAPGFVEEPDKYDAAVLFSRWTFPYLLFVVLVALYGGILNTHRHYGHAAAAHVLVNVTMIAALVLAVPVFGHAGLTLAVSLTLAGIGQFLWMVWAAAKRGTVLRLPIPPRLSPEVRRFLKLTLPGIIGGGAMQINLVIGTLIASLHPGAVSYLYYADQIFRLPLGIIGAATGVVLLPELTQRIRSGRPEDAREMLNRAIELSLLFSVPATVALMTVPDLIVSALLERGAFGAEARVKTAAALFALACGLPAFMLVRALAPAFYAREDTATPFRFAIYAMATNVAVCLTFFPSFGFVSIAAATALASWVNATLLATRLFRLGYFEADAGLRRRAPRILLVGLLLAGGLYVANAELVNNLQVRGLWRAVVLGVVVLTSVVLYFGLSRLFGAIDPDIMKARLRRKGRRRDRAC